jgi:thiamine-monophosphate kinase
MDISEIGKFGLISRIATDVKHQNTTTLKGIGDDAAIIRCGDTLIAVTTNTLVEGINFDLTYTPLQHLGYKSAVTAFSNLFAMNVEPEQLLVSIAVSSKFSVEAIDALYQGVKHACEHYKVDLVGGDTKSSLSGLTINVTSLGQSKTKNITYRNQAKNGDLICVSGDLGAAYMGLQVLEREKKLFLEDPKLQPKLTDYNYVIGRFLKPEARKQTIDFFAANAIKPTAMIDISDGLTSDLLHICMSSNLGCQIHHHKIPIAEETIDAAQEFHLEPIIAALNGGGDYELLFTVPVTDYEKVVGKEDISIIGYMKEKEDGCKLVTDSGEVVELGNRS